VLEPKVGKSRGDLLLTPFDHGAVDVEAGVTSSRVQNLREGHGNTTTAASNIEDMVGGPEFASCAQSSNELYCALNIGGDIRVRVNEEPKVTRRHELIASA